jgi:hypothetical protein
MTGVLEMAEDADGGEGGEPGMNKDGMQAPVAMMDTINTVLGTEPRKGLIRDASCCGC